MYILLVVLLHVPLLYPIFVQTFLALRYGCVTVVHHYREEKKKRGVM